jgi:hypothetical protein
MTDASGVQRERSPRAPTLSLRKALERAEVFYQEHKKHAVRVEDAVAAWNYGPKSSGGRQAIATLIMYGIFQDTGSAADRKVQLTDLALRWLIDERPEKRAEALRVIALKPKILADLWNTWGPEPPGDSACRSQLRLDWGFTEATAQEILGIYKDNIVFSGLSDTGIMNAANPAGSGLDANDFGEYEDAPPSPPPPSTPPVHERVKLIPGERELTTGLLSKDASFRLLVSGTVGVKEIERLIAKLQIDKEILADDGEAE